MKNEYNYLPKLPGFNKKFDYHYNHKKKQTLMSDMRYLEKTD